ncbi:MAG: ABC transporter permease [Vicinamibacterales bacterium]
MTWLAELGHRLLALLCRRRLERELDEELAFHLAMREEEQRNGGASAEQARTLARLQFGNVGVLKNQTRDAWIWPWLQDASLDLRYALRMLQRNPLFSAAAILTLALGLGATTTAFTFVNGAILGDLPFANPDRLVFFRTLDGRGTMLGVSYADTRDWQDASRTLSHVIVSGELPMNIADDTLAPQRVYGSYISPEMFEMVGRAPILGRALHFDDNRAGAPGVAVIAYSLWQGRYAGDPGVIGQAVRVNDVSTAIVGVMPDGFHFPFVSEAWMPSAQLSGPEETIAARRGSRGALVHAWGRLDDGVSLAQAQADMDAIATRLARDFPATNQGISVRLEPIRDWSKAFSWRLLRERSAWGWHLSESTCWAPRLNSLGR